MINTLFNSQSRQSNQLTCRVLWLQWIQIIKHKRKQTTNKLAIGCDSGEILNKSIIRLEKKRYACVWFQEKIMNENSTPYNFTWI